MQSDCKGHIARTCNSQHQQRGHSKVKEPSQRLLKRDVWQVDIDTLVQPTTDPDRLFDDIGKVVITFAAQSGATQ
jgi:hypothetical protein